MVYSLLSGTHKCGARDVVNGSSMSLACIHGWNVVPSILSAFLVIFSVAVRFLG